MGNKEAWTDNLDKKIIETEENERRASIKMSNTDYNKKYAEILRKRLWARVAIVGVSLVILIIAMIITTSSNNITKDKLSNSVGNLMEISTLTDSLEYYPKNMTTELNGYMADLSIDVSDTIVQGYMSLDGYSYLGYLNEDQTVYTEIIVSRDIPNEIGLTDDTINELKKQNEIIYESSSESDYNKVVNKAAVNLYNIGYLFVIQQVDEEFSDYTFEDTMIENIIDTMLYEKISDKTENKTYIEFDSFGTF